MMKNGLTHLLLLSCLLVLNLALPHSEERSSHFMADYKLVYTRPLKGGDLQEAEHELRIILVHLFEQHGSFYRVSLVHSATEEVVSGSKLLKAELIDFNNIGHECKIEITYRSVLPTTTKAIAINCSCMPKIVRIVEVF